MTDWDKEFEDVVFAYRETVPLDEILAMRDKFKRVIAQQRAETIDELVEKVKQFKKEINPDAHIMPNDFTNLAKYNYNCAIEDLEAIAKEIKQK